jgi:hypothetical protein
MSSRTAAAIIAVPPVLILILAHVAGWTHTV